MNALRTSPVSLACRAAGLLAGAALMLAACNQDPSGPMQEPTVAKDPSTAGDTAGRASVHADTVRADSARHDSAGSDTVRVDTVRSDSGKIPSDTAARSRITGLRIVYPEPGLYAPGTLRFRCQALYAEPGGVGTAGLDSAVWRSSLAGEFGLGSDFLAALPEGKHSIVVSVYGPGYRRFMDSVHIEIVGSNTLQTSGALDRKLYVQGDSADLTVKVLKGGAPRAGVRVFASIIRLSADSVAANADAVTDAAGTAHVRFKIETPRFPIGSYEIHAETTQEDGVGQDFHIPFQVALTDSTRGR